MSTTTYNSLAIPTDLNTPCHVLVIPGDDLSHIASHIGCEYVARVDLLPIINKGIGMDTDMWVDDCGLLVDRPVLNVRASIITGQQIFGNAVITGRNNDPEGDSICDLKFRACVLEFLRILQTAAESMVADGDGWTNPLKEEA